MAAGVEGTVCLLSSLMSPPEKKTPRSHFITGPAAEEFLPLVECISRPFPLALCQGRRGLAVCHTLPSSALCGLSPSIHSLESLLKPHSCPSKWSLLHASNTGLMLGLGRRRLIRKPHSSCSEAGGRHDLHSLPICAHRCDRWGSWPSFPGLDSGLWA